MNTKKMIELLENKEAVKLVYSLFVEETKSKLITEFIEAKQIEIINRHKFEYTDHEGIVRVINKPLEAYNLTDKDFNIYIAELDKFYDSKECIYKPLSSGNCPALEQQSKVRKIKREIVDFFEPYFNISYDNIIFEYKGLDKYMDLIKGLFSKTLLNKSII